MRIINSIFGRGRSRNVLTYQDIATVLNNHNEFTDKQLSKIPFRNMCFRFLANASDALMRALEDEALRVLQLPPHPSIVVVSALAKHQLGIFSDIVEDSGQELEVIGCGAYLSRPMLQAFLITHIVKNKADAGDVSCRTGLPNPYNIKESPRIPASSIEVFPSYNCRTDSFNRSSDMPWYGWATNLSGTLPVIRFQRDCGSDGVVDVCTMVQQVTPDDSTSVPLLRNFYPI